MEKVLGFGNNDDQVLKLVILVKIMIPSPDGLDVVAELIDPYLNQWKRDTIYAKFKPFEACLIVSIPPSLRNLVDKLVWLEENNWKYIVKSVSHFISINKK